MNTQVIQYPTRNTADRTVESLIDQARDGSATGSERDILRAAGHIAQEVAYEIHAQQDGAILASVTLAITDQRMKVAFLEEVGQLLLVSSAAAKRA
jgi:hypothetical protein